MQTRHRPSSQETILIVRRCPNIHDHSNIWSQTLEASILVPCGLSTFLGWRASKRRVARSVLSLDLPGLAPNWFNDDHTDTSASSGVGLDGNLFETNEISLKFFLLFSEALHHCNVFGGLSMSSSAFCASFVLQSIKAKLFRRGLFSSDCSLFRSG